MYIYLTEQAAEIWLTEEEVQTLVKGETVMGSPETAFLSPFGQRLVFVRQAGMEEINAMLKASAPGKDVPKH